MLAVMAVFANVKVRHDQGKIWRASPEITEIAGAMSFSTADAPYFLGHAAAAENGLSPDEFERKRSYPNIEILYQQSTEETPLVKRPLLSTLISLISPSASPGSLLSAGHTILLVSAGLTALMIMLAFGATGYWLEGAAAAIGGGLSFRLSDTIILWAHRHRSTEPWINVSNVWLSNAVSAIKDSSELRHLGCCGRFYCSNFYGLVW